MKSRYLVLLLIFFVHGCTNISHQRPAWEDYQNDPAYDGDPYGYYYRTSEDRSAALLCQAGIKISPEAYKYFRSEMDRIYRATTALDARSRMAKDLASSGYIQKSYTDSSVNQMLARRKGINYEIDKMVVDIRLSQLEKGENPEGFGFFMARQSCEKTIEKMKYYEKIAQEREASKL